MKLSINWSLILIMVTVGLVAFTAIDTGAQEIRASLFAQADQAFAAAKKARADVLAPKSYGKAEEHYGKAEKKFEKGEGMEDIRKELRDTVSYLEKAIEATKLAEVTFPTAIKARGDAVTADAAKFASKPWEKAEKKFAEAAGDLEDGDVNDARKKSAEAEKVYREAELVAIKTNFFDETHKLYDVAEREKVERYAPKSLAHSRELLDTAEKALERDRYDTDRPRTLAREAKYEAQHALYITRVIKEMDTKKTSMEDMMLASEVPLIRVAGALDEVATFDKGYEAPTDTIVTRIKENQTEAERLANDVADRDQKITDLEAHIELLEAKLGGVTDEQEMLKTRLRAQDEFRKTYAEVESMFPPALARVLREGNKVIIRFTGVSFDPGKSEIRPEHFALLTSVQQAINLFPTSDVLVEGHTDSYGTDEANLKLSEERADAVRQYLAANMASRAADIRAVGYGEMRPIANNETAEGRAMNRRIDIVIVPRS
jgi:OOP family OmpA-OmpF porin